MTWPIVKLLITAVLVVAISELARRSTLLGALLASIPLVSVLGMVWLYIDTGDSQRVAAFASSVLWLVLPSLVLFIATPAMLRGGFGFWTALGSGMLLTVLAYAVTVAALRYWPS
jgi:hypothetical protein